MKKDQQESRREFFKYGALGVVSAGVGGSLLTGCGSSENGSGIGFGGALEQTQKDNSAIGPTYKKNKFNSGPGYKMGVVCLNQNMPFIPGDVQCASTFDFPVIYKVAEEGTSAKILAADLGMGKWLGDVAIELEKKGVKGLTGDSGYMVPYQKDIARSVDIPVALSSLIQIPFVGSMFAKNKTVAVVCAAAPPLSVDTLNEFGVGISNELVVHGMQNDEAVVEIMFRAVAIAGHGTAGDTSGEASPFDAERLAESFYSMGKFLKKEYPNLGGVILECSDFPPYAAAMQAGVGGLPVFDFIGIINMLEEGTRGY